MATFFRTPWKAHESYGNNPPPIPKPDRRKMPRKARGGKFRDDRGAAPRGNRPQRFDRGASFGGNQGTSASTGEFRGGRGSFSRGPRADGPRRSWSPERDFRGNRGGGRGGFGGRGRNNRNPGENIDPSRFVNKAVVSDQPEAPFVPEHQFADFALQSRIKLNLAEKGYVNPTPIQDKAIEPVLEGKDIVGLANTGTGKTGAFLIPLISRAFDDRSIRVLVMAPTRELTVQIADEFKGFARALSMHAALCVGGAGIFPQIAALRHNPQFVIGTPGRLKDLMERGALDLSDFTTVVLDEADRMLDMGFIDDMRFIMGKMPEGRHTLFFSATMSREIEKLIGEFLNDPVTVSVRKGATASTIDQDVVHAGRGPEKFDTLVKLLEDRDFSKVLVFGRTKHGVERLAKDLNRAGIKAEAIHGNKTHGKRLKALDLFKSDKVQVLVATDVAARGLDISGVSHVINFDLPGSYEDYVHRIGRTGRAGKTGKALTFI
jgi:superfamily II DNA/RNA helicase